ncbi:MAG: exonuclease SbcCD subunit D [Trueperaceae bacterium]
MRILHTADWHAGRTLHGADRTPEVRAVLGELADMAISERVDAIVVAGDLYDSRNPSAAAEDAVYDFFLRTGAAGIPSVAIAGNHDSPARFDAVSNVLRLAKVHTVGAFRPAGQGGLVELELAAGRLKVAALPFLSERRMIDAEALLKLDLGAQRDSYRQVMRKLVTNLTQGFDHRGVNVLAMHTTFEGATLANSEYAFHCTSSYTVPASLVPATANYVAVGHIHKPQAIEGLPENKARYSGSPLQLDFGEVGDHKSALLVEAEPGKPSTVTPLPLSAGRRLFRVVVTEQELDGRLDELAHLDGWLKLVIKLERPKPGLKERLQQHLPDLLTVEQLLPGETEEDLVSLDLRALSLVDAYRSYLETERGMQEPDSLVALFQALHDEVSA